MASGTTKPSSTFWMWYRPSQNWALLPRPSGNLTRQSTSSKTVAVVEKMAWGREARIADSQMSAQSHLAEQQPPSGSPRRWFFKAEATERYRATLMAVRKKTLAYIFMAVTYETILHIALPKSQLKSRAFSTAQNGKVSTNWKSVTAKLVTKRLIEDFLQPCLLFIR